MLERLYITAEDEKLHRMAGAGALMLCGKVMVRPAVEDEISTLEKCEDCERVGRAD